MAPLPSSPLCLVVTDMSGFTRTTRKHGIIHMTSLIWKTRQTLRALFTYYGAISIRTEADNNFAVFTSPVAALSAALQVQAVIDHHNDSCHSLFHITMGGVGVAYGQIKQTQHLYTGNGFFDAFLLGEDISAKREVLITDTMKDIVYGSHELDQVKFEQLVDEEFHNGEKCFYRVNGMPMKKYEFQTHKLNTLEEKEIGESLGFEYGDVVKQFLAPMLKRFIVSEDERKMIDEGIAEKYLTEKTVLMYGAAWDKITEQKGIQACQEAEKQAKLIVDHVIDNTFKGHVVEDALFIFEKPTQAIAAAVELRKQFQQNDQIPYTGFGIHIGKLLFAQGTNVHWGDPVNTASKLGQDYCKNGEIVVSDLAWEKTEEDIKMSDGKDVQIVKALKVEVVEGISISGVDFRAYSVQ